MTMFSRDRRRQWWLKWHPRSHGALSISGDVATQWLVFGSKPMQYNSASTSERLIISCWGCCERWLSLCTGISTRCVLGHELLLERCLDILLAETVRRSDVKLTRPDKVSKVRVRSKCECAAGRCRLLAHRP